MRKVTAYALLQLACWIGRLGMRAAGVDMRESEVMLQAVPTPERAQREADEAYARIMRSIDAFAKSGGGSVPTSALDRRSKSSKETN